MNKLALVPLFLISGCLYKNNPEPEQITQPESSPRFIVEHGSYFEPNDSELLMRATNDATYSIAFENGWLKGRIGDDSIELTIDSDSSWAEGRRDLIRLKVTQASEGDVIVDASYEKAVSGGGSFTADYKPVLISYDQPFSNYMKFQFIGDRCLSVLPGPKLGVVFAEPAALFAVLSADEYEKTDVTLEWCAQQV